MSDRIHPAAIDATGYVGDGAQALHDDGTWKAPAGGGGSGVQTIVPGTGIAVDSADPANPVVSATGSGGGGGGTVEYGPLWPLDKTPATPNAMDDEFTGTALAAKWAIQAPVAGTPLTYTLGDGLLFTEQATPSTQWNLQGLYQAVPSSGDWEFTAAVASITAIAANYIAPASLMLAEGLASTSRVRQVCFGTYAASVRISEVIDSTWAAYSSTPVSLGETHNRQGYLRVTKTGTSYAWKISPDGKRWHTLTAGTLAWTPTHVIIGGRAENGTYSQSALWKWFRRTA